MPAGMMAALLSRASQGTGKAQDERETGRPRARCFPSGPSGAANLGTADLGASGVVRVVSSAGVVGAAGVIGVVGDVGAGASESMRADAGGVLLPLA